MKKIFLAALSLCSLSLFAQSGEYILKGKLGTLNAPAKMFLSYRTTEGVVVKDSSELTNGTFELKGQLQSPVRGAMLYLKRYKKDPNNSISIWIEPGTTLINGTDSLQLATITGSKLNTDEKKLRVALKPIDDKIYKLINTAGSAAFNKINTPEFTPLREMLDTVKREKYPVYRNFIQTHPNSLASLFALIEYGVMKYSPKTGLPEVEPLFNKLSENVRNSVKGKLFQAQIEKWKKVDVGTIAQDFTLFDQNGKKLNFSAFKGKYVLLDFWASWCHPCREENPNLVKQYDLYKDKNFTIVSVSLDTKEKWPQWKNAIEKDGLTWPQLVGEVENNEARLTYAVQSIPDNFLINPAGVVIAKGLRKEELGNKLKEIFQDGTAIDKPSAEKQNGSGILSKVPAIDLSLDSAVRYGKLTNGFTYYIRKNAYPKDRVVFYLANKVGSILENDDQQGLAHFMEHMNFNGTTHFPKNELVNYLQKAGVRFGADINAYTNFTETVYQLPLPSDKPDIVQNGITIMKDWAQGATLDSLEIDKERGVVLEEKRVGKGAGERMRIQYFPVLLNQSRFAKRLPIGTDEVLNNFKPATLRSFYKDWYRPDLQALIVVGDVDVDEMEKTIKEKFADLKNPVNEKQRIEYSIPLTGKNQFIIVTDKEQPATVIQVGFKRQAAKLLTAADYRNYIIQRFFNSMINDRINELTSNKANPPYMNANVAIAAFLGGLNRYNLGVMPKPGEIETGFKAVWRENERVKRYGFTQSELDRARNIFLGRLKTDLAALPTASSPDFINEYLQHFLNGTIQPGIKKELELATSLAAGITLEDIKYLVRSYTQNVDRDILITAPEKDRQLLPDENTIEKWISETEQENIVAYKDTYEGKIFFNKTVTPGKIVNAKPVDKINATEWTLSNGVKVIVKPTNFLKEYISFSAFAPGGSSVYDDKDYPSAAYAAYVSTITGIGDMNVSEAKKYLSDKDVAVAVNVGRYASNMNGRTTVKDLETCLQFVNLRFGKQKLDKSTFDGKISGLLAGLTNSDKSPEGEFVNVMNEVKGNGNIRARRDDSLFYKSIHLEKAGDIYNEIFGNTLNFTFTFVGDIDTAILRPLVEKYIGSLPQTGKKIKAKDLGLHPPAGTFAKVIYKGTEQKSIVNLTFSGDYIHNESNNKMLDALKEVLKIRLVERLREEESGVYSPSVGVTTQKIPANRFQFSIGFSCNPDNVEKLIASALDEVNKLKVQGPSDINIGKFKAEDLNTRQLRLKDNFYWVTQIQESILNSEDVNTDTDYENIMKMVSKESIKDAANRYLSGNNLIKFILMPEKYKN